MKEKFAVEPCYGWTSSCEEDCPDYDVVGEHCKVETEKRRMKKDEERRIRSELVTVGGYAGEQQEAM